jgi:hypothetical protein
MELRRIIGVVILLAGLIGSGISLFTPRAGADEIYLDAAESEGTNPFVRGGTTTPSPFQGANLPTPPLSDKKEGVFHSYPGTTPGLYGGVQNTSTCNTDQIIGFLEGNPAPAAVWSRVLRIPPSAIRSYVTGLTPVILRTDTRVTSYGLKGDEAIASQAVLQAGTSILTEPSGLPRVRCGSGNPLDTARVAPRSSSGGGGGGRYLGTPWPGFSPTTVIVIAPTRPIGAIIIVDLNRGVVIIRIPGGTDVVIPTLPPLLRPGDPDNIIGRGFPPGTLVTIRYDIPAVVLGTTTADGGGNVAFTVVIPAGTTSGLHVITAEGGGASSVYPVYILA